MRSPVLRLLAAALDGGAVAMGAVAWNPYGIGLSPHLGHPADFGGYAAQARRLGPATAHGPRPPSAAGTIMGARSSRMEA